MCHNSITGGHINFILGSQHENDTPTSEAQNGCHINDGCLATGPRILHNSAAVYDLIFQKK